MVRGTLAQVGNGNLDIVYLNHEAAPVRLEHHRPFEAAPIKTRPPDPSH